MAGPRFERTTPRAIQRSQIAYPNSQAIICLCDIELFLSLKGSQLLEKYLNIQDCLESP